MDAPSQEVGTARELDVANLVALYHFVAKMLRLWVPTNPVPHRAKVPKTPKIAVQHALDWLPFLHKWGCGQCLRIFRTRAASAKHTCSGLSQTAVKTVKAAQNHGHQLMVCNYLQSPGSFVFCNRCGCYSQVRVIGLGRTCVGRAGSQLHRLHTRTSRQADTLPQGHCLASLGSFLLKELVNLLESGPHRWRQHRFMAVAGMWSCLSTMCPRGPTSVQPAAFGMRTLSSRQWTSPSLLSLGTVGTMHHKHGTQLSLVCPCSVFPGRLEAETLEWGWLLT